MRRCVVVLALLGTGLLVLVGCAGRREVSVTPTLIPTSIPTRPASSNRSERTFPPRVSNAGQVVIEVIPLNLNQPEETLHFQVAMNTHSVELGYDLAQLAVLRTDRGDEVSGLRWDGGRGGHHVNGTLYFPVMDLDGARWVELVIQDVANVPERVFRWEMKGMGGKM